MRKSARKERINTKITGINTFPVPFTLEESKENITLVANTPSTLSKEQIINQAFQFHSEGNIQEAIKYYQYFINKGYQDHRVFSNYGVILKSLGKLKESESSQRKAIKLKPDFADAHSNLGNILRDLGKLKKAEISTRKAIKLKPDFAEAYSNLGNILRDLGQLQVAKLSARKAIELKPNLASPYFNLFRYSEEINILAQLEEDLKEFSSVKIIKDELLLFRARLKFRNKEYQTAKKLIDSISPEWIEKSDDKSKIVYWNYKAFIEDKVRNYDLAYSCFEKSQLDAGYTTIQKNSYLSNIDDYKKSVINKEPYISKVNNYHEDSNLVFLIGFPRSGTTLLDTILRSHPDIEIIEEKPLISTIEYLIKENFNISLDNIFSISSNNIMILRKRYFELLNEYRNREVKLIIDKMPLHTTSLPLINLLFPNAKIIFTHRHPYDTVLSCFQQSFKPNEAMSNLVSLKSSARMYDRVMDAWAIYQNNLTMDYITSKYEHLIESFDNHTLKILNFLGVEWNDNVKNYRETALARDKIYTPSSSQVIQPLYKSSIEKWKNYEKYFEDCHQYLEKWVVYFDY